MRKRSPYCYSCGNEKEPSRQKQSDCLTCHAAKNKNSRAGKVNIDIQILIDLVRYHPDFIWIKKVEKLINNKKVDAKTENSGL